VRNCHELGECWPSQESVVHRLKVSYLELQLLSAEIYPSPEGYGRSDLTNRSCCCTRDSTVERSRVPQTAQCQFGKQHLVEYLQEQDVQGAASIDKDSVELDILDDGANDKRIPPRLWYEVQVVTTVKDDGDLGPLKVLRVAGETIVTSPAVSFCFLLDS
jgi:hypothetical protein